MHEFRGNEIVRWWDYPDLDALLGSAPQWWLDHIMAGYEGGPSMADAPAEVPGDGSSDA